MPQIALRRFASRQIQCVAPRAGNALDAERSIIWDGKLIGAVTNVMINDPTEGYGIFIENMLQAANQQIQPKAA